ncbi:MAG: hypothetical protein ACYTHM_00430 [Planctomycetota bacterium]|jgi:hypothetical protein
MMVKPGNPPHEKPGRGFQSLGPADRGKRGERIHRILLVLLVACLLACCLLSCQPAQTRYTTIGPCATCEGSGMFGLRACPSCQGLGFIRVRYPYPVTDPVK